MIKISPSILSADFAYLARDIQAISTADYVHVDVMDGLFVPNISIGIPVLKSIRKVTDMFLDVHLMITQPVRYVEEFCDAGADLVTVHVEADFPETEEGQDEKRKAHRAALLAFRDFLHDRTKEKDKKVIRATTEYAAACKDRRFAGEAETIWNKVY